MASKSQLSEDDYKTSRSEDSTSEFETSSSSNSKQSGSVKRTKRAIKQNIKNAYLKKSKTKRFPTFKKKYQQKFNDKWCLRYKWMTKSKKGDLYFYCRCWAKDLKCESDGLIAAERHELRKSHIKQNVGFSNTPNVFSIAKEAQRMTERVKEIEIRVSMFILEYNLSISVSDHLIELIKSCSDIQQVMNKLSNARTKCGSIIRNVIGEESSSQLINTLKNEKFSLLIDESTDISGLKHLTIIARYLHDNNVQDDFLTLIPVTNADHETLYNVIVKFFEEAHIPFKDNMVSFGSDGANVMFGRQNSVMAKLKRDVPNLFVFKCACHSLALCASKAAEKFPSYIEELLRNVYNYLKYNKRNSEFGQFQKLLELPEHRMLKICGTRWLSTKDCVLRFLEQYDALSLYFDQEMKKDSSSHDLKIIHSALKNPWTPFCI